jgi:hypothetical protein
MHINTAPAVSREYITQELTLMNKTQTTLSGFPKNDFGYFHLTTKGWIRKDSEPFPDDRVETWSYDMEWPTGADKEQVRLVA